MPEISEVCRQTLNNIPITFTRLELKFPEQPIGSVFKKKTIPSTNLRNIVVTLPGKVIARCNPNNAPADCNATVTVSSGN